MAIKLKPIQKTLNQGTNLNHNIYHSDSVSAVILSGLQGVEGLLEINKYTACVQLFIHIGVNLIHYVQNSMLGRSFLTKSIV